MSDPSTSAPDSLVDGRVGLLAVDAWRTFAQRYAVELSEDLFGAHIVETAWGRTGDWTASQRVSFAEGAKADPVVAHHPRRRLSADRAGMTVKAAFVVMLLVATSPALAWGDHGHRAIANIAWTEVTPASRREVIELLKVAPMLGTPACLVGSLEDAATWADCVRSHYRERYAGTATWHYVDVSICAPFRLPNDPEARFVVARYRREAAVLADRTQTRVVRLEALLWVAHLVGDLHQPLHVGDAGDRGGNEVDVYPQHGRYPVNLHAEWDRVLVDETIEQTPNGIAGMAVIADGAAKAGQWRDLSPGVWARESWDEARRAVYAGREGRCAGAATPVDVGGGYERAAVPVVRQQLERAGGRLAEVLNSIFVSGGKRE